MAKQKTQEKLIEKLAELEHQQWIEWSKALAGADEKISEDRLDKWAGLWKPYKKLSEEQKEKDRIFARKVIVECYKTEIKWLKSVIDTRHIAETSRWIIEGRISKLKLEVKFFSSQP
jgi:hypothetical protein